MIRLSQSRLLKTELHYLETAIEKGEVSVYGENLQAFESEIERLIGQDSYVTCTNSGTSAIHLALILAGVEKDDEVICQSLTFFASAAPILYQGAQPIFVDSEIETWNMNPFYLEAAIKDRLSKGKKPKAIIVVHLYGMPAKMDEIVAISNAYQIPLIEDAAESFGSKYKNRYCGTFGQFGVYSFNGNKIITTSGGGALITKTDKEKQDAIFYASQSRDHNDFYQHSSLGYNYRMSNLLAGLGRAQMKVLEFNIQARRKNNEFYQELFTSSKVSVFKEENDDFFSNHWLTCILVDSKKTGFTRHDIWVKLKEHQIESRVLWKPMHLQPIFQNCPYYGERIAESLFETGLCLPSSSILSLEDKLKIKSVLGNFLI